MDLALGQNVGHFGGASGNGQGTAPPVAPNTFVSTQYLNTQMQEYFKAMEERFAQIPGLPRTIEKEAVDGYNESPFVHTIAITPFPNKFSIPNMPDYDGTGDPDEHVSIYKQKITTVHVKRHNLEAVMCKAFGSTLTGAALTWFIHLPLGSITSFDDLINRFKVQFASSRRLEKQSSDLYRITQGYGETTRDFMNRFNREKVQILNCDVQTSIEAFRQGLPRGTDLYNELTKYPCRTFEDVQARAMAQVRWEEDYEAEQEMSDDDGDY